MLNLEYLLDLLDEAPITSKYKKLNSALVGLIEDFSLVCFIPIDVNSDKSLLTLKSAIDKVNSYLRCRVVLKYFLPDNQILHGTVLDDTAS